MHNWRRSRPALSAVEVSVFQYTYTRTTEVLWGKRDSAATLSRGECLWSPWSLPQGGSAQSLALTNLYRFFRPLTSKKVLFYNTKVCLGWLSFADNREDVTEYIKGGHLQCKRRNGQKGFVPYLPPDSVKIKIPSKPLLASGWGRFFFSKSHSSLSTMQAWFRTGELIRGHGSCLPTSLPTGFSEWGLSHISHTWNSSPHPWAIHMSSLASTFPILLLMSPCLFCNYHLCFLFLVVFSPILPTRPPHW